MLGPMKVTPLVLAAFACFLWAAVLAPTGAQEAEAGLPPSLVTPAILESKIAETEAFTELAEEAKGHLVERYRKALSHLEAARANEESAAAYKGTAESAPAQIQAIHASLEPDAPILCPSICNGSSTLKAASADFETD